MIKNRAVLLIPNRPSAMYGYMYDKEYMSRHRMYVHVKRVLAFIISPHKYVPAFLFNIFLCSYSILLILNNKPAKSLVNSAVRRIAEAGLLYKFMTNPLPLSQMVPEQGKSQREEDTTKLDLNMLQIIFYYFLLGGLILAWAAFTLESWETIKFMARRMKRVVVYPLMKGRGLNVIRRT